MGDNDDLALTLLGDDNGVTEVGDTTLNLDLVVKELLESGDVEDLVGSRLGGVDHKLLGDLLLLSTLDSAL